MSYLDDEHGMLPEADTDPTPPAKFTEWTLAEQPIHGPELVCLSGGFSSHEWELTIEEGCVTLSTDCIACGSEIENIESYEYNLHTPLVVTIESRLETYGWETPEYDHWFDLTPIRIESTP